MFGMNSWLLAFTCGGAFLVLNGARLVVLGGSKTSKTPKINSFLAFFLSIVCGAILALGFTRPLLAIVKMTGGAAGAIGAVGILLSLALGLHSAKWIIAAVRDLADGQPDKEARAAALFVPSTIPAGWAAITGMTQNPTGFLSGTTAVIGGAIALAYAHSITKTVLASSGGRKMDASYGGPGAPTGGPGTGRGGGTFAKGSGKPVAKWVAEAFHLLAGLMLIPTTAALDATLATWLPGPLMIAIRTIGGISGLALLACAAKDICDREPDQWVRAFSSIGIPLLFMGGSLAIALLDGGASNIQDVLRQTIGG